MKTMMRSLANALMVCLLLTAFSCSEKDDEPTKEKLPPAEAGTKAPYKVGDYYNVSRVKGVVFEASSDGKKGTIVSLDEAQLRWALDREIAGEKTNARDMDNGMNNMDTIKGISGWKSKYPAFVWCDEKNANGVTGWYFPAINELKSLYDSWNAIEDALLKYGENFKTDGYVSSTESDGYYGYYVYHLSFATGNIGEEYRDNPYYFIRAIRKF
jgi:hypothetical protein